MERIITHVHAHTWSVPLRRCHAGDACNADATCIMRALWPVPLHRPASWSKCGSTGT
eukprot:CAMPEP_0195611930 /NCGR_PEP_ID=MMETSP0815-20121206/10597_1 /TAXON_ID=97485 /ORGANISM="Prymnesium parvum, Strain Texoma1" /LENGTH=56 /DNA_ID=CAMNT_0040752003 /DNA_START=849 /DNA_END=1019 /DNA_ORIENTATION=-